MDIMTLEDVPFVFGVFIAPLVAVAVFTTVLATRRSGRVVAAASVLSALVAVSLVTYWAMWGSSFDELDAGRAVPQATNVAANVAIGVSATAATLLLVLGIVLTAQSRRTEPTPAISVY